MNWEVWIMKSRTLFFNFHIFKKDITRFAPVWVIYIIGCLLVFTNTVSGSQPYQAVRDLDQCVMLITLANFCYALLTALLLYGDMFQSRLCNALHAMPLRREEWFFSHLASGLFVGFVPILIVALSFTPMLEYYWLTAFTWAGIAAIEYLFFFSLAVFCMFCAGNRYASVLLYGILNFLSLLIGWFAETLFFPKLYGFHFDWEAFWLFCPIVKVIQFDGYFRNLHSVSYYENYTPMWIYLAVIGVLGLVLLVGSLLLYRKRKLETAGDFLAVGVLKPVFRIVYTLTVGALFQLFNEIFLANNDMGIFLIIGLAIGYFTGHMLIQRRVKIFTLRTGLGFLLVSGVLLGSIGLTALDPFGIIKYVPKPEDVYSVAIRYEPIEHSGAPVLYLTEDEDIQTILDVHQDALDNRENPKCPLYLTYTLNNGRQVTRQYSLCTRESIETMNAYFSRPEMVLGYTDWNAFINSIEKVTYNERTFRDEEARDLLEQVKLDCEDGVMAQSWQYQEYTTIPDTIGWLEYTDENGQFQYITLYGTATHTLNWLRARDLLDSPNIYYK